MARILICHVPKDGSTARDLGAALMGRGHYVSFDGEPDSPRPERAARLRQFEVVIVVWSKSAHSPGLSEIARDTLPLNLLVPIRAEDLAPMKLPLAFRKLNMLGPRDFDGIARAVARFSTAATSLRDMAEREAARRGSDPVWPSAKGRMAMPPHPASPLGQPASHPPQPAQSSAAPVSDRPRLPPAEQVASVASGAGRVRPLTDLPEVEADDAFMAIAGRSSPAAPSPSPGGNVPDAHHRAETPRPAMQVLTADDLAQAVEAGLLVHHIPNAMWLGGPATVELALGRDIVADLFRRGQFIETLSVSLYGSSEAFEIERQSERTQFVSVKHAHASRDPATFGRWAWLVTPYAAGPQDLVVRISALLRDRHGVPAPVAIPDRRYSVDIQVPENESLVSALAGWYRR